MAGKSLFSNLILEDNQSVRLKTDGIVTRQLYDSVGIAAESRRKNRSPFVDTTLTSNLSI